MTLKDVIMGLGYQKLVLGLAGGAALAVSSKQRDNQYSCIISSILTSCTFTIRHLLIIFGLPSIVSYSTRWQGSRALSSTLFQK